VECLRSIRSSFFSGCWRLIYFHSMLAIPEITRIRRVATAALTGLRVYELFPREHRRSHGQCAASLSYRFSLVRRKSPPSRVQINSARESRDSLRVSRKVFQPLRLIRSLSAGPIALRTAQGNPPAAAVLLIGRRNNGSLTLLVFGSRTRPKIRDNFGPFSKEAHRQSTNCSGLGDYSCALLANRVGRIAQTAGAQDSVCD
jgi:hypothetical protein